MPACSPAPVERDPGKSWGTRFCFAGGGGWVEGEKDSANAFPLLSSHSSLNREFIPEL